MLKFNWTQFLVVDQEDPLFMEVTFCDIVSMSQCVLGIFVVMHLDYQRLGNFK